MTEAPDAGTRARLDRSGYDLAFADDFSGPGLDLDQWIPHYLPEWTTPDRSAARYALTPGGLRLVIAAEQPAWHVEDGEMRVSNLQTGTFSGPLGSPVGQMRHRPDLLVRTPQLARRLWTPSAGLVEATVRASADPTCMLAVWLVGHRESGAEDVGEILLFELYGNMIGAERSTVRLGVKAHTDPRLQDDITDLILEIDATEEHSYAAEWNAQQTRFYIDEQLVRTVEQGIAYPLQLMVDLFEFPGEGPRDPARYPKSADVRRVRGYRCGG